MKILVVDDDRLIRESVMELVINGFTEAVVVMGISGQDGWREFQESQPDLVITDRSMETGNAGFELARKIKGISPATPVIMVSGTKVDPEKDAEKMDSVDFFLLKPFNLADLVKAVGEALEGRKEGK